MAGPFSVALDDGRRLAGWESGENRAPAVLFHVGTPAAGIPFAPLVEDVRARGAAVS